MVEQAQKCMLPEHPDLIQSFEWNADGSQIATTCKDRYHCYSFVFIIIVIFAFTIQEMFQMLLLLMVSLVAKRLVLFGWIIFKN